MRRNPAALPAIAAAALLATPAAGPLAGPARASEPEDQAMSERPSFGPQRDGQKDFDFLIGSWKIHNRRLRERLKGSTTWDEFEGTVVARHLWGGLANVDEYDANGPSGRIRGLTVRLYDPKARQWSLYWANAEQGRFETPVVGSFENGRGDFYDQEMFEGRSIYVRFTWSDITQTSCRWSQAFSADGGKTWETNWVVDFTRVR